jgi:hypothetical protein
LAGHQAVRTAGPEAISETKSLCISNTLWQEIVIYPTPGPPGTLTSDAIGIVFRQAGIVRLQALLCDGSDAGGVGVSVSGLPAGVYAVSAVAASSGSSVDLGTVTVRNVITPISTGSNPVVVTSSTSTAGYARFAARRLHVGLFDVATIVVTGTAKFAPGAHINVPNGPVIAQSQAEMTPLPAGVSYLGTIPTGYYNALSPFVSGTAAPGATGFVLIRAACGGLPSTVNSSWPGTTTNAGHLRIHARGLPANTSLTYAADGTDLGNAMTDSAGSFNVYATAGQNGTLPARFNLFAVKTVTVHDASGNVLVSAGF